MLLSSCLGSAHDRAGELDDVHVDAVVQRHGTRGRAAAEADDERVSCFGMHEHRQVADAAVHEHHPAPGARLVIAVDRQRHLAAARGQGRRPWPRRLPPARESAGRDSAGRRIARRDRPTASPPSRTRSTPPRRRSTRTGVREARETDSSTRPETKVIPPSAISDDWLPSCGSRTKPAAMEPRMAPDQIDASRKLRSARPTRGCEPCCRLPRAAARSEMPSP